MANLTVLLNRAVAAYSAGKFIEAEELCQRIVAAKHNFFDALHVLAVVQSRLGKKDEALASYDRALKVRPDHAEVLYNRGITLQDLSRWDEALASYDRALKVRPDYAEALSNRANTLQELNRLDEALASHDRALKVRPDDAEVLCNRGNTLHALKRLDDAMASYNRALAVRPNYAKPLYNLGNILRELNRLEEALANYDRALEARSDYAEALCNRGVTLHQLKRLDEALASCDRALRARPDYAEAHYNRGVTLHALRRRDEALASYDRALKVRPDFAEALYSRGVTLCAMTRCNEALASFDRALALRPDYAEAHYNRGLALNELNRLDEALASHERALAIETDHPYAFGGLADAALKICDWARTTKLVGEMEAHVAESTSLVPPFVFLCYSGDAALQLKCAHGHVRDKISAPPHSSWNGKTRQHEKIRVAYLSADYRRHATAFLMAELFELHDRSRFEVLGVSFGADDASDMRSRLTKSFDQFHDVRQKNDGDVAKLMNELEVDIAIDLKGYTHDSRPGILAHRPAPIQVNYLGYPGTMGADFIDYVIADKIVLPFDQQPYYVEKIVHLPDCYQVNDSRRTIAGHKATRRQAGLPESGVVFCCFNNNYKITPPVFEAWMRLLRAVDGSVLWLLQDNDSAAKNLRKEAAARGIDPARLVFAGRMPLEDHLARHDVADLFLDTLPVNAHTTASDALWAGLPVLTCRGESFAGRVAASLLHAVGLPELVTSDLEEYEALALKLAREPSLLAGVRTRLARHRDIYPLFNSKRFTRHLEAACATMSEIRQRGESPRSFSVEPDLRSASEFGPRVQAAALVPSEPVEVAETARLPDDWLYGH
jgi:protein O-GlcNAc transferase